MMDYVAGEEGDGDNRQPDADPLAIWQSVGEPMLQPHPQAAARIQITVPGWETKVV
jgi:hypothetical protein